MLAFALWGASPVYWKLMRAIPAAAVAAHRVAWSLVVVAGLITWRGQWRRIYLTVRSPRQLAWNALSAALLGSNWWIYVWAVNHGRVVECSLGYYINPLLSMLLGLAILRERLGRRQVAAVALAAAGVANLEIWHGSVPWVALSLAATFGLYGLMRKTARLGSVAGLACQTLLLLIPAAILLGRYGDAAWDVAPGATRWFEIPIILAAGAVTAVPLVLFAFGARRIRLATLGFLQYLAPTGMFILGVAVYGEPVGGAQWVTFPLIWIALALYSWDSVRRAHEPGGDGL